MSQMSFMTHRKIAIIDNSNSLELVYVDHFHFSGWEDWQVPVNDSMDAYQQMIESTSNFVYDSYLEYKKDAFSSKDFVPRRLLVHCRAGIGRTGTTIAIINMVC